jgi:hypothetical protein
VFICVHVRLSFKQAKQSMRKSLKIAVLVVGVLFALAAIREAFVGYNAYFVIVPGAKLYTDDKPVSGWLHQHRTGRAFILTLSGPNRRESYLIDLADKKGARTSNCGDWTAPRFPLIPLGDWNPCQTHITFASPNDPTPKSLERRLDFGSRFIEFTADDGRRIKTSW